MKLKSQRKMYALSQLLEMMKKKNKKMIDKNFWNSISLKKIQLGLSNSKMQ